MAAQRRLLRTVNSADCWREKLAGISIDAIERFARINSLAASDDVVQLLTSAAKRLQCLATKSQEQLTEEYADLGCEIDQFQHRLKAVLTNQAL
jgi:hypothetical protein